MWYIHVHICVYVCVESHMCVYTRVLITLLSYTSPFFLFLRQGLSLTLELIGSGRLADYRASRMVQSLPFKL